MTLGSALPWRTTFSPLGRSRVRSQATLTGLGAPWTFRGRSLGAPFSQVALSSNGNFEPGQYRDDAHLSGQAPPAATANTTWADMRARSDAAVSFIDRLSKIPLLPHRPDDHLVVRPVASYPHPREDEWAQVKHRRALVQQARLQQHRQQEGGGDWKSILAMLMKFTGIHEAPTQRFKVVVPRNSIGDLLSREGHSLWKIRSERACLMQLMRPIDNLADVDPYVVIRGQSTPVLAAVDDILKIAKGVTVIDQSDLSELDAAGSGGDARMQTTTILPQRLTVAHRIYELTRRADRIRRPKVWTVKTFDTYVAALVDGVMDPNLARKAYRNKGGHRENHKDIVARLLYDVFHDPDAAAAVSVPAINLALRYLTPGGETYAHVAQALLKRARELDLRPSTDMCNLVLETAVATKNLLAFESTLSQMVVHKHQPNLQTWLLFLRLIESEEVMRFTVKKMDTKGFFADPVAVRQVAAFMADVDAHRAIQEGQGADAFLAGLRELYGPGWQLNSFAGNRYLDIFGRYSKFDDMTRLLEYWFSCRSTNPSVVSLNTAIAHCKQHRQMSRAIQFVRMFEEHGRDKVANEITFRLLYMLARKTRKPHTLGAVWRYANRVGMTDSGMREHAIKMIAAHREIGRLTGRLDGLWRKPVNLPLSRQEFVSNLFVGDYKVPDWTPGLSADDEPLVFIPRPRRPLDPVPPPPSHLATPSDDHGDDPVPSITTRPLPAGTASKAFRLYTTAMMKDRDAGFVPAVPLSEFLQRAFLRDGNLFQAAKGRRMENQIEFGVVADGEGWAGKGDDEATEKEEGEEEDDDEKEQKEEKELEEELGKKSESEMGVWKEGLREGMKPLALPIVQGALPGWANPKNAQKLDWSWERSGFRSLRIEER